MSDTPDHIDVFFALYPDFNHDSSKEIWAEFERMCDEFHWENDGFEKQEARRDFKTAIVKLFNDLYGTNADDITAWQKLHRILSPKPVPEDLKLCRQRVRKVHVNLIDLVDGPRNGATLRIFPNVEGLREYTIRTGKFFPREDAYAGGVLRFLLREITGVHQGKHPRKRQTARKTRI